MKVLKLIFGIIIIFYFNSCDILRTSPFEVTTWSPGSGYHEDSSKIIVSLKFSHEPDKASVERHFSLTEDGSRIKGKFSWNGRKMTFVPYAPLTENIDYSLILSAEAHNTQGLSMDTSFNREFTTKPDKTRPVLLSCYPPLYAEVEDLRMEVRLDFSLSVPLDSLYNNVSFSPSMIGLWRLENYGKTAIFTPSEPWIYNRRYEIRLSNGLTDNKNTNIGSDFNSVFTIGTDHELPELLGAARIDKNGELYPLERDTSDYIFATDTFIESQDWEKEDKLLLVFSKPVDSASVKNFMTVEGFSSPVMESVPGHNTEFIFYFETKPVYESRFVIRLRPGVKDITGNESKNEYIFRVFANGKYSKPPELAGIRLPLAPGSNTNQQLVSFGKDSLFNKIHITEGIENYPPGLNIETWIELYFDTADGAVIDQFSLMELFRIDTTNNVLTYSPRRIKTSGFSEELPEEEWKNFERVEISGYLTNSVNFGIIIFQIAAGLRDSLNNKNDNQQRILLIK